MPGVMAFAMYRPRAGKAAELQSLVHEHLPNLREYGLITARDAYMAQSKDGTIIEVFEWVSWEAKDKAHEHPGVAKIWEKMGALCEFPAMKDLPEGQQRFPDFQVLK